MYKTKEVTFFLSSLVGGGAQNVCVNLANGMSANGWQVTLVVLHLNNADYLQKLSKEVNLQVLGANHISFAIIPIVRYLKMSSPKKVLVFNYELTILLILIRGILLKKFKIISRNNTTLSKSRIEFKKLKHKIIKWGMDALYHKVDHVINQCHDMKNDLLSVYPKLEGKTSFIYNPVRNEIEIFSKNNKIFESENYLLYVGRLEQEKAIHFIIEAFSRIHELYPSLRLRIIGKGSQERNLKKLAQDLKVLDKIDFKGFNKNIIAEYCKAKVVLLTSFFEGFPNVLIESITLGTPIVSFDCPSGPNEIIKEGVNGYLVSYLSIDDLVDKIKLALSTNFDKSEIKKTAFKYSNERILNEYIELLTI